MQSQLTAPGLKNTHKKQLKHFLNWLKTHYTGLKWLHGKYKQLRRGGVAREVSAKSEEGGAKANLSSKENHP